MMKKQLFAIALLVLLAACNICGEEFVKEIPSADGKYSAVIYRRDCGATTPFVTHVNIKGRGETLQAAWTGTIDLNEGLSVRGAENVIATWQDHVLTLEIDPTFVIKCAESVGDVRVSCVAPSKRQ
jgi:hypothetical protein